MNRRLAAAAVCAGTAIGVGLVMFNVQTHSASADGKLNAVVESTDPTLKGAVVRVNGRDYNCVKYTTVDRGGVWCERVQ